MDINMSSQNAEEAIVGCVMINPEVFDRIVLPDEAFYIHRLRFIWQAFRRLKEKMRPIDLLTVSEELTAANKLEEIGGMSYLIHVVNQVPSSLHAEHYAEIILEHYARRQARAAADKLAAAAINGQNVLEIPAMLENAAAEISNMLSVNSGAPRTFHDIAKTSIDQVIEAGKGGHFFPTGLVDIDRILDGGFERGVLSIIAGRPGTGKSSLIGTIIRHQAERGIGVGVLSLEMSSESIFNRLAAQISGINLSALRTGRMNVDELSKYYSAVAQLADYKIIADDTAGISPSVMRLKIKRMMEMGAEIIYLDYLQLMEADGRQTANRQEEVSAISRALVKAASYYNVPLVAAAQLSRAVEMRADGEPHLSDLRESGALEQDASVVILLYRDEKIGANIVRAKIAKHRNGNIGTVALQFDTAHTEFRNLAIQY